MMLLVMLRVRHVLPMLCTLLLLLMKAELQGSQLVQHIRKHVLLLVQ